MKEIRLKAYAKINLGLDVLRRREDGYHDLRMIMQSVGIYDRVYLKHTKAPGIRLQNSISFLPADEGNLAFRAAKLLMDEFGVEGGVFIELQKHIPVAAGLGGGSSDAAAVLVGMNRLFGFGLNREELMERGLRLGADVPFCILRGTALAEGVGELLTPLSPPPACSLVLAKPSVHVSTRFVYGQLKADEITVHPDIDAQMEAIRQGDLGGVAALMGNVLESVTIPAFPVIAKIKEEMLSFGAAGAMMSGSGPTVFALFEDPVQAQKAAEHLRRGNDARQVFVTEFYAAGKGK